MEKNKEKKEQSLLDTALKLFTEKGIAHTTIQDIVDHAGVAKGTFYLYFKDKYDIQQQLITTKCQELFQEALRRVEERQETEIEEQVIIIIDYIIEVLRNNKALLGFISKNLSAGILDQGMKGISDYSKEELFAIFESGIRAKKAQLEKPAEVTFYMIIELVGSTGFNSILYQYPMPIDQFKPYLYQTVREMIRSA